MALVDARTYGLWGALACREDLPDAALSCVVRALTVPSDGPEHTDRWRQDALLAAMPALLARVREPDERAELIRAAGREQVLSHLRNGLLGPEDLPAVTAAHRVWPALILALADRDEHVRAATDLVTFLDDHDLAAVVTYWDTRHRRDASGDPGAIPDALLDAILERLLAPCARALVEPETATWPMDWIRSTGPGMSWRDGPFGGPAWQALERCPHRWADLVEHPHLKGAVRHLLLTHAATEALDDDLLTACLPALTCPELADLPKPSVTQRERLSEIADRARRHPRVLEIAAEQVHAAATECMRRGRLASARNLSDHGVQRLAQDLAVVGDKPRELTALCEQLARLPQPTIVVRAQDDRYSGTGRELGWNQGGRVAALARLAANPRTPRDAVIGVLERLHPAETAALAETDTAPAWLRTLAADHRATDDTTVRLLTDDELDAHPNPAAVLASWLENTGDDDPYHAVAGAVGKSRHCTPELLLRLPADDVLGRTAPHTATPVLIDTCGDDPKRWAALFTALDRLPHGVSLGELLATIDAATPARSRPAGVRTPTTR
ncbi:hypothetical protein OG948_59815 (plasmid) [Embleya sp. NBC_00888]|uniref:hypothetical protein n=1 Tax=Embleya sp. NBC_00888 TaxID=2975960 RepID=UPI002F90C408|nr:hypothetical protein OG948_59815 [Embleya sp. NBC_00888]